MKKKLIIAEKPSVASDFAKVLGKFKKIGNYYENDKAIIASAIGHVVELYMPDDYDKKLKWWTLTTLPIIPDKVRLKPIEKTQERFEELKELIHREDVSEIINACDAGREGELIFTYLYELAKGKKPVKRLWMSSMTEDAIKDAFKHLKEDKEMVPLKNAAKCRSEADWLIGINGTRAVTGRMFGQKAGQIATVGRVQTPTLSLIHEREQEIKNFEPTDYWKITGEFKVSEGKYEGTYQKPDFKKGDNEHDRVDRIWEKEEAEKIIAEIKDEKEAKVNEEKKRSKQIAPMLYDLTSLQREANSRFGMPAGITLKTAQSLYEKHKVLTYPRTDSKCLPEDYGKTVRQTLANTTGVLEDYAQKVIDNDWINTGNKRIFDNKKVSDHFAIIPTGTAPKKLSDDEQKIFDMVSRRFIAAFYPAAEFDVTTRITEVKKHKFKTEGKVLAVPGWLEVHGKDTSSKEHLPALSDEDGKPPKAAVKKTTLNEESTKPPARYSEATLLAAMESAGKFVEDEELAEAMKERGLGTPATRAQTIEHLIREKYVDREQRELIPTIKAENLMNFLKAVKIDYLTSAALTGEWEFKLREIEHGRAKAEDFMLGVEGMTVSIVEKTKDFDESKMASSQTNIISPTDGKPMTENFRAYRSQDGELTIYKTMGNRKLEPEEVKELLEKKVIGPLDGFKSKAGKPFSAMLKLEDNKKVKFDFGSGGTGAGGEVEQIDFSKFEKMCKCPMAVKGKCSHNNGQVYATPTAYQCEFHGEEGSQCNFRISRTILSRTIPEDQFVKMATEGKTDLLDKFKSNRTKRFFSAHLILKDNGTIGFEFAPKAAAGDGEKTTKKKATTTKKTTKKATTKKAAKK